MRLASCGLVGLLALGALTVCSDEGDEAVPTTTSAPAATTTTGYPVVSELPPNDVAGLKEAFDPVVEPLGLRITRGALVDRTDGYVQSDTGTHLALYVEPIDDDAYPVERYTRNLWDLTATVTPAVFEQYPGLESYDICQEPHQADDSRYEPFPVTQIELSRADYESFDWSTGDLPSVIAFLREAQEATIVVNPDITRDPTYLAALDEAGLEP